MRFWPSLWLLLSLLIVPATFGSASVRRAVILYTASLQGELEDCGCKDARGGLARRHAFVAGIRTTSEVPVFVVDVGDSLRRVPPGARLARPGARLRDRFLVAQDVRLGLDARTLGPLDLALGRRYLAELLPPPPPLAANLRPDVVPGQGARLPGFRVVSRGGLSLGFVGVVADDLPVEQTPGFRAEAAGPAIREAAGAAREAGAEAVVLLSTLGLNRDYRLVREGLGVDLVLGGRSRDRLERPLIQAGVPIMQAGVRGQAVGRVDLGWSEGGVVVQHEVVDLTADLPEDPEVAVAVRGYLSAPRAP